MGLYKRAVSVARNICTKHLLRRCAVFAAQNVKSMELERRHCSLWNVLQFNTLVPAIKMVRLDQYVLHI